MSDKRDIVNRLRDQRDEDGYCVVCGDGKWESHFPKCTLCEAADEIERLRAPINEWADISDADLVKLLRERSCPAGLPWTGDNPEEDHGHTDCWLHMQSAREIERLRSLLAETHTKATEQ